MVSIFEAASAAVRIRSAAAIASDGSTRTDLLPVWDATDASAAFGCAYRSINIGAYYVSIRDGVGGGNMRRR